jgi:hypothetical protein
MGVIAVDFVVELFDSAFEMAVLFALVRYVAS